MYWYYKYPLLLILVILLGVICIGIGRSYATKHPKAEAASTEGRSPAVEAVEASEIHGQNSPAPSISQATLPPPSIPVAPPVLSQNGSSSLLNGEEIQKNRELLKESPLRAREAARKLLKEKQEFSEEWLAAAEIVNDAGRIFMNSNAPAPEKKSYVIQSGDSLDRIARKFRTTIGALQRLNQLNPTESTIHPGRTLRYIEGNWSIRISKPRFRLCLYLNGELYRMYKISTGRQDRTPEGLFVIINKSMRPSWSPEPGKEIPYGDPANILGTRWMGLRAAGDTQTDVTGLGIHGTTEPESIGTASSLGCIRLLNDDVDELYDFIPQPQNSVNFVPVTIL